MRPALSSWRRYGPDVFEAGVGLNRSAALVVGPDVGWELAGVPEPFFFSSSSALSSAFLAVGLLGSSETASVNCMTASCLWPSLV